MFKYIIRKFGSSTSVQWDIYNGRKPPFVEIDLGYVEFPIGVIFAGNNIVAPGDKHKSTIYDVSIDVDNKTVTVFVNSP